jgi:hypothetical protein
MNSLIFEKKGPLSILSIFGHFPKNCAAKVGYLPTVFVLNFVFLT